MSNLSEAMKKFWENKSEEEKSLINKKRSESNSQCIYIFRPGYRIHACKPENLLDRLIKGYKIVKTPKNLYKIKKFFGEIPEEYFENK